MKLDLLRGVGAGTVNNIYHKHFGRSTSAKRILAHLGQVLESSECSIELLKAEVEDLKTEVEKLRKMVSAKGDQATAQTKKRGKRNGNY
tara:strand:- start:987 stop:1253 length:267 start_codon:yes stop_codon:yes gene_type:complete